MSNSWKITSTADKRAITIELESSANRLATVFNEIKATEEGGVLSSCKLGEVSLVAAKRQTERGTLNAHKFIQKDIFNNEKNKLNIVNCGLKHYNHYVLTTDKMDVPDEIKDSLNIYTLRLFDLVTKTERKGIYKNLREATAYAKELVERGRTEEVTIAKAKYWNKAYELRYNYTGLDSKGITFTDQDRVKQFETLSEAVELRKLLEEKLRNAGVPKYRLENYVITRNIGSLLVPDTEVDILKVYYRTEVVTNKKSMEDEPIFSWILYGNLEVTS